MKNQQAELSQGKQVQNLKNSKKNYFGNLIDDKSKDYALNIQENQVDNVNGLSMGPAFSNKSMNFRGRERFKRMINDSKASQMKKIRKNHCNSTQNSKKTDQAMEIYDEYMQITKRSLNEELVEDDTMDKNSVTYIKEIKKGDVFRSSCYKNMISQYGPVGNTPKSQITSTAERNHSDTRLEMIKNKLVFQKFKVDLFNSQRHQLHS